MSEREVDYGPLAWLIATWHGDKGLDISPEPDGREENPYYETIVFEAVGDVTNAECQRLAAVRYQQIVRRKSNDKVFHDQTGYWMWDAATGIVMQSLTIPRSVCVLAGGKFRGRDGSSDAITLQVMATLGDRDWGIIQSPFMWENARTIEFRHTLTIQKNTLSYSEDTRIEIYGRTFHHTDQNELIRCDA